VVNLEDQPSVSISYLTIRGRRPVKLGRFKAIHARRENPEQQAVRGFECHRRHRIFSLQLSFIREGSIS
jgi:hypothetical protein